MTLPWIWYWRHANEPWSGFEYADRILTRWSDQKVHNMNDVLALDQEHQKKAARRAPASQARSTGFTNFQQRDYDFDELEKQLLESQH